MYCRHCRTRKVCRPRRLCEPCFYTSAIKAMYPTSPRLGPRPEQTAAELDKLIEERRRTAPAWFREEDAARELFDGKRARRDHNCASAERFRAKTQLPRKWRARA